MTCELRRYFPNFKIETPIMTLTRNFFQIKLEELGLEVQDFEEDFFEVVNDSSAKDIFVDQPLAKFWVSICKAHPTISLKALTLLIGVPSRYLCESTFSAVVEIKLQARNRLLDIEPDLRCAISSLHMTQT